MHAQRARLPDGRWHFQHGPVDLVIDAEGRADAVEAAHDAAWRRFATVLAELVAELPLLKRAVVGASPMKGAIADRMWRACAPHARRFVTPMAAVAGAVADELIASYRRDGIDRASVNNGGDIALHLTEGHAWRIGLVSDLGRFDAARWNGRVAIDGRFEIAHAMPVRGVATSGWRGRSFSLGIADSVTVLARTAAEADAAATMIANEVDVADPRIHRAPASSVKDDSDLGDRLVIVDVPTLGVDVVRRALRRGLDEAEALVAGGSIFACALACQGQVVTTSARLATDGSDAEWHDIRFTPSPNAPMLEAA